MPSAIDLNQALNDTQLGIAMDTTRCHVDTLEDLRYFLKPALASQQIIYSQRIVEGQRYHLLTYVSPTAQKQRVVIAPDEIMDTELDRDCALNPSLSFYLGTVLDTAPPKIPETSDPSKIAALQKLADKTNNPKLKLLYLQKVAKLTSLLAKKPHS